jgi:hypothetical protein
MTDRTPKKACLMCPACPCWIGERDTRDSQDRLSTTTSQGPARPVTRVGPVTREGEVDDRVTGVTGNL